MRRILFNFQPVVRVANTNFYTFPLEIDVVPFYVKSTYDQIIGESIFSTPVTILATTLEEGVNFPFYTRDTTAKHWDPPKKRKPFDWIHSTNTAIMDAPPNETPITVGKIWELPPTAFKKKQDLKTINNSTWIQGRTITAAPATTYSDNSCRMLSEIQRHMLELVIDEGDTWQLWNEEEVRNLMNHRLAKFALDSGIYGKTTISSAPTVLAGDSELDLPEDLIILRRVAFENSLGELRGLMETDSFALDNGSIGWENATGDPYAYVQEPRGPLSIALVPTPDDTGTAFYYYLARPEDIPEGVCAALPFPAAFTPFIKYGIMADMFMKEGEAHDPVRAVYCEKRYTEGVELAKTLLGVRF